MYLLVCVPCWLFCQVEIGFQPVWDDRSWHPECSHRKNISSSAQELLILFSCHTEVGNIAAPNVNMFVVALHWYNTQLNNWAWFWRLAQVRTSKASTKLRFLSNIMCSDHHYTSQSVQMRFSHVSVSSQGTHQGIYWMIWYKMEAI